MNCKKCNAEFEPTKGLLNYCSISCRNSRSFSEETNKIKREKTIKNWEEGIVYSHLDFAKINNNKEKKASAKLAWYKKVESKLKENEKLNIWTIRKYLIETNTHECWACHTKEWKDMDGNLKPVPLVIDHINGNNKDNRLENLRIICRNCDGLLDTFCARNIGRKK